MTEIDYTQLTLDVFASISEPVKEYRARLVETIDLVKKADERRERVLNELDFRMTCKAFDDKCERFTGRGYYCLPTVVAEDYNDDTPAVFVQVSDWVDVIEHDDDPDRDPDLSEEYDAYFLVNGKYKYYTESFCGGEHYQFRGVDIEPNKLFSYDFSPDWHYIECADWDDCSGAPLYAEFNDDGTRVRLFLKRLTW